MIPPTSTEPSTISIGADVPTASLSAESPTWAAETPAIRRVTRPESVGHHAPGALGESVSGESADGGADHDGRRVDHGAGSGNHPISFTLLRLRRLVSHLSSCRGGPPQPPPPHARPICAGDHRAGGAMPRPAAHLREAAPSDAAELLDLYGSHATQPEQFDGEVRDAELALANLAAHSDERLLVVECGGRIVAAMQMRRSPMTPAVDRVGGAHLVPRRRPAAPAPRLRARPDGGRRQLGGGEGHRPDDGDHRLRPRHQPLLRAAGPGRLGHTSVTPAPPRSARSSQPTAAASPAPATAT